MSNIPLLNIAKVHFAKIILQITFGGLLHQKVDFDFYKVTLDDVSNREEIMLIFLHSQSQLKHSEISHSLNFCQKIELSSFSEI